MSAVEDRVRRKLSLCFSDSPSLNSSIGMSPVTDLAFNLSGLSTDCATTKTPQKRLSWSSYTPNRYRLSLGSHDESMHSQESPLTQQGLLKDVKLDPFAHGSHKMVKRARLSSHMDRGKENISNNILDQVAVESPNKIKKLKSKISAEGCSDTDSQDSGYAMSVSEKTEKQSSSFVEPFGIPPRRHRMRDHDSQELNNSASSHQSICTVRSTLFSDESDDGFMDIFEMDKLIENTDDVPSTLTNLLTKPLSSPRFLNGLASSMVSDSLPHQDKIIRPSIRRCLSMNEANSGSPLLAPFYVKTMNLSSVHENGDEKDNSKVNATESGNLSIHHKQAFKRPNPPKENDTPTQCKRRKSLPFPGFSNEEFSGKKRVTFLRYHSENEAIMRAVQKSCQDPDLIGDFSKTYALPLVTGKHQDLKTISPETVILLLEGQCDKSIDNYTIVDCRYPYEYEGGHIKGAINIYSPENLTEEFFSNKKFSTDNKNGRHILVFHCEFSSERGPNLCRFLRKKDRETNKERYPYLHYPELYVLNGGYKAFYERFKENCEPREYKSMLHKGHEEELRHFRAKSKSWNNDTKARVAVRPGLKF